MRIAMIGLGRMGGNMTTRLLQGGHEVVVYDRSADAVQAAVDRGAIGARSLPELVEKLPPPRAVWVMVPAGVPTESTIQQLAELLAPGDTIVDGGNSNWHDSQRRAAELGTKGLRFADAGTSGGIWGLTVGYCLMVGGSDEAFAQIEPALKTLAPPDGYLHCGPAGSGHFVKMVHNGIEYGLMQAYAEGFDIMKSARAFPELDLTGIARLWGQGSVVRSWLLELAADALERDPGLQNLQPYVEDSGEGRWTVLTAIEEDVPAPVITLSLFERFRSRQINSFTDRMLAALRNEFGGHAVRTVGKE
ncbi:MAG TPA: decarboxylating 6-phosphogluconate dehydrogenase [Chloroflexota bacterium]|jgi:6-phosphogluconate dehydrogenase|nr:decarboxylating 6-phosphogluconate dehydrogenase [Chloroflexota bacterium]